MTYEEMKATIHNMADENYEDFINALISFELEINAENFLERLNDAFFNDFDSKRENW
jgi:hypothetical protein